MSHRAKMNALEFSVIKTCSLNTLGQSECAESRQVWNNMARKVLSTIPVKILEGAKFPETQYGYEYYSTGPEQILDIVIAKDSLRKDPLLERFGLKATEAGLNESLGLELKFYDTQQGNPEIITTRGLRRISQLKQMAEKRYLDEGNLNAIAEQNLTLGRLETKDGKTYISPYGKMYLDWLSKSINI